MKSTRWARRRMRKRGSPGAKEEEEEEEDIMNDGNQTRFRCHALLEEEEHQHQAKGMMGRRG